MSIEDNGQHEREYDQHWRNCHSLDRPGFPGCDHRAAHSAGDRLRDHRRGRDAVAEGSGTSLQIRYDLLLVPAGVVCFLDFSLNHALERELSPVHPGYMRLRLRVVWPFGASAPVE